MRRILLVEDEEHEAAALMRELRKENLSSALAGSIDEMESRLIEDVFDCVVLDLSFGPDPHEVIALIPDIRKPVVVYTGNTDPEIVKAVRATGAAYVEKPGLDLLIEKIWSQINFKSADDESAQRQQRAQRALRTARPLFATKGALVSVILTLSTATAGTAAWAFNTLSGAITKSEEVKHKFVIIDTRIEALEKSVTKMDGLMDLIKEQNRISIDDRQSLRESQKELKIDIQSRLERIERKLDSRP